MKLWIDTSALAGSSEQLLWRGALYGLIYLNQHGHYCSFKIGDLSDAQQKLLHNEKISTESFPKDEADAVISADGQKLTLQREGRDPILCDDWIALSRLICFPRRTARHQRNTAETKIKPEVNLDGKGENNIDTGIGFLDHMLQQVSKHGLIDLSLTCEGDIEVDEHHTIEDVAIALGTVIRKALGEKTGIGRYGFALPMDESEAKVLLDFSGRPYLTFQGRFDREKVGEFPTEMVEHFFYSLAMNLKATLHITVNGKNDHHKIEACFKSFARCLRVAVSRSERARNVLPSTKDLL